MQVWGARTVAKERARRIMKNSPVQRIDPWDIVCERRGRQLAAALLVRGRFDLRGARSGPLLRRTLSALDGPTLSSRSFSTCFSSSSAAFSLALSLLLSFLSFLFFNFSSCSFLISSISRSNCSFFFFAAASASSTIGEQNPLSFK